MKSEKAMKRKINFEDLLACLDCCESSLFEDDDFDKLKEATDQAFELYKQYC